MAIIIFHLCLGKALVIYLGRLVVPTPKIVINLSWTYEKLHCNRKPYRFSCKQDPSLHTDTETSSYFYITYFRADFWAYAGQAGLRQAISRTDGVEQADLKISFQTGRVDCPTAPYTDVDVKLPAVHLNYEDLVGFFADRYEAIF